MLWFVIPVFSLLVLQVQVHTTYTMVVPYLAKKMVSGCLAGVCACVCVWWAQPASRVRVSRDAPPAVWRGDPGPVFFLQASYPPKSRKRTCRTCTCPSKIHPGRPRQCKCEVAWHKRITIPSLSDRDVGKTHQSLLPPMPPACLYISITCAPAPCRSQRATLLLGSSTWRARRHALCDSAWSAGPRTSSESL